MAQSSKVKGNKAKGRQSSNKKGYYERQTLVPMTNKLRRRRQAFRQARHVARQGHEEGRHTHP